MHKSRDLSQRKQFSWIVFLMGNVHLGKEDKKPKGIAVFAPQRCWHMNVIVSQLKSGWSSSCPLALQPGQRGHTGLILGIFMIVAVVIPVVSLSAWLLVSHNNFHLKFFHKVRAGGLFMCMYSTEWLCVCWGALYMELWIQDGMHTIVCFSFMWKI